MLSSLVVSPAMSTVLSTVAAATPADDKVSPGLAGFLTMFGLALVTVLLVRSMVGHLRKVRYSPDPGDPGEPQAGLTPTAPAAREGTALPVETVVPEPGEPKP